MDSNDPASQYVPLGSVFIAIAIVVWTSVAVWLCYSGPPGNDSSDSGGDSASADGSGDVSNGVISKVAHGFAELLLESKDKASASTQCDARSLDLSRLEELLTPSKSDCRGTAKKIGKGVSPFPLGKVGGSGIDKDGNGSLSPVLAGLNFGKDSDKNDLASVFPGRSRVDIADVDPLEKFERKGALGSKREAAEDFLKELLHPQRLGFQSDDKGASSLASFGRGRGKFSDSIDGDEKENSTRPAMMLSMADHAREIGNKHLTDKHFAAAVHCYEVACLLYPASGGSTGQLAAYHCNCALACLELGRYGDAINECNAALVLSPPKPLAVKALYRLAVAYANLKNAYEARRCLKRCLQLDPSNEYAKACLDRLGEEDKATRDPSLAERQLVWVDPPKRVQCLPTLAREKAKGKKAKQKSTADEPASANSSGRDASARTPGVKFDRDAGLWHSMAKHGSKLYVLGGWSDKVAGGPLGAPTALSPDVPVRGSDELHVFDVDTFELRQLNGPNSKPPHPCYGHTATVVGNSMFVFGGCGPAVDQPPFVMVFDIPQAKWRVPQTTGIPPRQRQGHSANAVQADRHLCVFGGIEPTGEQRVARIYNDANLLDLQSFAWRKLEVGGHRPPARFGHTATTLPGNSGKLLVVGGRDHLGVCPDPGLSGGFTGLHVLDTERRTWQQQSFSGSPPSQAFYHTACLVDDSTVLVITSGGANAEALALHLLDLESWTWSSPRVSGPGPAPRIGHTALLAGSRVYSFGGVVMRDGHAAVDKSVYVLETRRPEDDICLAPAKDLPPKTNHVAAPCEAAVTATVRNGKHALGSQKATEVKTLVAAKESEPPIAKVVESAPPETPPARTAPKARSTPNGPITQNGTSEASAKKPTAKADVRIEAKPETIDAASKPTKRAEARAKARARAGGRTEARPEARADARPEVRAPRGPEADVEDNAELLGQDEDEFDGDLDDATGLSFEELLRQEKAFFKTHQAEKQSFPRARDKESKKNRF